MWSEMLGVLWRSISNHMQICAPQYLKALQARMTWTRDRWHWRWGMWLQTHTSGSFSTFVHVTIDSSKRCVYFGVVTCYTTPCTICDTLWVHCCLVSPSICRPQWITVAAKWWYSMQACLEHLLDRDTTISVCASLSQHINASRSASQFWRIIRHWSKRLLSWFQRLWHTSW